MTADNLIIYQNDELIIANKPSCIPVQPDLSGDDSLLEVLEKELRCSLHLINRIDRPVSGLVMIAKNGPTQKKYAHYNIVKTYIAIVHQHESISIKTLSHYHKKNSTSSKAFIENSPMSGYKPVELTIESLSQLDNYTAIKAKITSGKFHQIRAQLAHIGAPVKGDVKYGARRKNHDRSIMLHSYGINIKAIDLHIEHLPDQTNKLWKAAIGLLG